MASWEMRIVSSSGKSSGRRFAICSGLHAFAHRRSWRPAVTATLETNGGTVHLGAVRPGHETRQAVLDVGVELLVIWARSRSPRARQARGNGWSWSEADRAHPTSLAEPPGAH